jgi:hypothetical protein
MQQQVEQRAGERHVDRLFRPFGRPELRRRKVKAAV